MFILALICISTHTHTYHLGLMNSTIESISLVDFKAMKAISQWRENRVVANGKSEWKREMGEKSEFLIIKRLNQPLPKSVWLNYIWSQYYYSMQFHIMNSPKWYSQQKNWNIQENNVQYFFVLWIYYINDSLSSLSLVVHHFK